MRQKKEQGKSTGRFVDIYIYIYLDGAVVEDVAEPGESSVLVALVEEPHLLPDDLLGLRAAVLVEVHDEARITLIVLIC